MLQQAWRNFSLLLTRITLDFFMSVYRPKYSIWGWVLITESKKNYQYSHFLLKILMNFSQKFTWFINSLIIVSRVTFFFWLDYSLLSVSFYLCFCLNRLTTRAFPSERQTFPLYAEGIIKTKIIREGKTQMPHDDTKLRKPKTQSKLRKTAIIAGV